jgi:hypothetical protein
MAVPNVSGPTATMAVRGTFASPMGSFQHIVRSLGHAANIHITGVVSCCDSRRPDLLRYTYIATRWQYGTPGLARGAGSLPSIHIDCQEAGQDAIMEAQHVTSRLLACHLEALSMSP